MSYRLVDQDKLQEEELTMVKDLMDFNHPIPEAPARASRGSKKKRKWREIEAIKDRLELRRELQELDMNIDEMELEELI